MVFIADTLAPQLSVQLEFVSAMAQCEADFRGALGMDNSLPDLQNLQLTISIQSQDSDQKVQHLYEVWQQRCLIYLGLTKGLPVKAALEITQK